jgi:ketosteroid isomerase-like protein
MTNSSVVRRFVARINAHDINGIVRLMARDHVFVDSLGNRFTRPEIEAGWQQYFVMVPDYRIRMDREVDDENSVILFGTAAGTYVPDGGVMSPNNRWETPAVWRAIILKGKVYEWRIYSDNEPIRAKIRLANH